MPVTITAAELTILHALAGADRIAEAGRIPDRGRRGAREGRRDWRGFAPPPGAYDPTQIFRRAGIHHPDRATPCWRSDLGRRTVWPRRGAEPQRAKSRPFGAACARKARQRAAWGRPMRRRAAARSPAVGARAVSHSAWRRRTPAPAWPRRALRAAWPRSQRRGGAGSRRGSACSPAHLSERGLVHRHGGLPEHFSDRDAMGADVRRQATPLI